MRHTTHPSFVLSLLPLCGLIGTMSFAGHRPPSPPESLGHVVFFASPLPQTDRAHVCELQSVLRTIHECDRASDPSPLLRRYRVHQIAQYNQIAQETTPAACRRAGLPECIR